MKTEELQGTHRPGVFLFIYWNFICMKHFICSSYFYKIYLTDYTYVYFKKIVITHFHDGIVKSNYKIEKDI